MTNKRIKIGVITGAHGIRGQVKIRAFIESPNDILAYEDISDMRGKRRFSLIRHGIKDKLLIAGIDGVTDRNQAELLKGTELYAPSLKAEEKTENEWYYDELIGLEARLASGKRYGKVSQVYNFGAGDIIEIKRNGSSELLPFNGNFVGDIHTDDGYLIVFPPDYIEAGDQPE